MGLRELYELLRSIDKNKNEKNDDFVVDPWREVMVVEIAGRTHRLGWGACRTSSRPFLVPVADVKPGGVALKVRPAVWWSIRRDSRRDNRRGPRQRFISFNHAALGGAQPSSLPAQPTRPAGSFAEIFFPTRTRARNGVIIIIVVLRRVIRRPIKVPSGCVAMTAQCTAYVTSPTTAGTTTFAGRAYCGGRGWFTPIPVSPVVRQLYALRYATVTFCAFGGPVPSAVSCNAALLTRARSGQWSGSSVDGTRTFRPASNPDDAPENIRVTRVQHWTILPSHLPGTAVSVVLRYCTMGRTLVDRRNQRSTHGRGLHVVANVGLIVMLVRWTRTSFQRCESVQCVCEFVQV